MKLNAKVISVKGLVAKVLTVGLLTGAVAMFAPVKAEAQQVYFHIGTGYGGNGYDYEQQGYYERERAEECRRQEEFARRQAWIREQQFRYDRHGRWGHRGWDGDRFDQQRYDQQRYERDRYDRGGYR